MNDSLGHAIGDALLFEIASRLSESVGPGDVVARLGGDEFTVLQASAMMAPTKPSCWRTGSG